MPSVPKWLANTMEKMSGKYYHPVTVTYTKYLNPFLKLVRFDGDLQGLKFTPGNVIEFRVSDSEFRHYTPSSFNAVKGYCEVIFFLHQKGPGSLWAGSLSVGEEIKLIGPGRKMAFSSEASNHVVFGDETSLGLMQCMEAHAEVLWLQVISLAEISNPEHLKGFSLASLKVVNTSSEFAGVEASAWITGKLPPEFKNAQFYLTGRARSIQNLTKSLRALGVNKSKIQTYPYWSDGKKGL